MSFNNTFNYKDYDDNYDYNYSTGILSVEQEKQNEYLKAVRLLYIIGYAIICSLGLVLNLVFIVASCHFRQKSDTAKWVLALALTHLICSAFLPFQLLYSWYHFNWHYGTALCKISSYVLYTSLFSTAAILTLWSVSKGKIKCFERCCTAFSSVVLIMVMSSWTFAVILSVPSLYSRELQDTALGQQCVDDYDLDNEKTTSDGKRKYTTVVCYRFIIGILIPAFVIGICRFGQRYEMEKDLKRIMNGINVAYFVCWTPLLATGFVQVVTGVLNSYSYVLPVATLLAAAHCCVNPVIYLLMGQSIKMQWMKQVQETQPSTNSYI